MGRPLLISLLVMSLCGVAGLKPTLLVGGRQNPGPSHAAICSGVGGWAVGAGLVRGSAVTKPPFPGLTPERRRTGTLCPSHSETLLGPRLHCWTPTGPLQM